ncbi:CDP-alcohol phosphatidyltransferase family protein [Actinoplanes campanulatus]|uniref:CDP-alcohol phosphatidyltransferase family protein n=1 Tax=Actinoplanes campanulatus TaxID=113559 RepID=UPI001605CFC3|nr:CDP-alcohol phosphatidyltransferase family protein [Actinoplanes campanulatus]
MVTISTTLRPLAGFAAQVLLLAVLAATVGLTGWGWLAGLLYGLLLCGLLAAGLRRAGMTGLGWANAVTFGRAILAGGVTAMAAGSGAPAWLLAGVAGVALAMDGLDGQIARRTGTTTGLGARFDMEVDSALALVLSVYVAAGQHWLALVIGLARYLSGAASWALPWLNAPLPPRFSRKVVAAEQGIVLVAVASGVLPPVLAVAALVVSVASLAWSFGTDVVWLYRAARVREQARSRWSGAREHALAR